MEIRLTPKALLGLLLIPVTAYAAMHLYAANTVAGLGTTVEIGGLESKSTYHLQVQPPAATAFALPFATDAQGEAHITIGGDVLQHAGTYHLAILQKGQPTGLEYDFTVEPDVMDPSRSQITAASNVITPDGYDSVRIHVTLHDRYGNALEGRPVALVSNRTEDVIAMETPYTDTEGTQEFSLSTTEPGTIQLRALDMISGRTVSQAESLEADDLYDARGNGISTTSNGRQLYGSNDQARTGTTDRSWYYQGQLTQTFDVIDRFEIITPNALGVAEDAPRVTVRAIDRFGNTVEDYTGTIRFASTDPEATLPNFGTYTFQPRDLGRKEFPLVLRFRTPGTQTLRVEDAGDPRIFGEVDIEIGGTGQGSQGGSIIVTSHQTGDFVNTTEIIIEGSGPRFSNLVVMGGIADRTGSSDAEGRFAIPVSLNPAQRDFTIRVLEETGRGDSGPIVLSLDTDAPEIGTITFAPEQPEEGENTLIVVQSEPGLAQVSLQIPRINGTGSDEVELQEVSDTPGTYQSFFAAPATHAYQPTIVAMDKAGNTADVRTTFTVGKQGLPIVQNVRATPKASAVSLEWDAVDADVDGYRIYVGQSPTDFQYTLDTGDDVLAATVSGLTPGQTYFFSLTAIRDDLESAERSDVVEARTLGLTISVEPGDSLLQVRWAPLSEEIPLDTYLLEYGASAEGITEKRQINGDQRDYTMRDLINGVNYSIVLTPITVTGDKLVDLAATGSGTPIGGIFTAGARDPVPGNVPTTRPGAPLTPSTPPTPSTGLPPIAWGAIVVATAGGLLMHLRRKQQRNTVALLQQLQGRYTEPTR